MKNKLKKFVSYIITYVGITMLFTFLIIGCYLLPNNNIRKNVAESLGQLKREGNGYTPFFDQPGAMMDTHTDALMLNIAMNKGMGEEQRTLVRAVENSFYEDETQAGLSSLEATAMSDISNNHEYTRYWHGSQVILRPLLMFFNYTEIRYILMFVIFILLGIVIYLMGQQIGLKSIIAFIITICMMYVILIPMSLQYSCIFIVTLMSMIAVLLVYKYKKSHVVPLVFFIIGAVTTYFDLLTYPLISLGFPITIAVIMENRKGTKLLNQILFIIKLGILWAIGYSLLFFTKWVIASIILHKDAITLAINQILFRVNGNETYKVDRIAVLKENFDFFFIPIAKWILRILAILWIIMFVLTKKKFQESKVAIPLLCIAIVPYMWYIMFAGHSSIHSWFTNKIQAMTVFAILCAMGESIKITNLKNILLKRGREK